MKKKLKQYCHAYMIRPIVYKTLMKSILSLVICGLWDRFCNQAGLFSARVHCASILFILFAVQAWFTFLRLDGVNLPRLPKRKRHKNTRAHTGDIGDYGDTEIIPFEELQEDERDVCVLVSALICALVLLLAALL